MVAWRRFVFALALLALPPAGSSVAFASETMELAQAQPPAQPTPAPSSTPSASPSPAPDAQPAAVEPIGNVATVTGIATVIRDKNSYPLRVRDDIYLNDVVQTSSNSSLGITFNDATTFNLSASARITIDNYVYEDGGKQNAAIFDVGKGTVAFVAAAVAKTGNMKITTPTATLGIRGTTGVVDVPEGAAASRTGNVNIKLYPDADGRVGHIDVDERSSGTRLGALTQASSGFAIRPGAGAGAGGVMRFAAVPIAIPAQQIARDRGFVSQVHLAQSTGRQIVTEQRDFRRANPGALSRIPRPGQPQQRPLRPNTPPGLQPQRPNGQPGQNIRPGRQPDTPNRQGAQPPQRQGQGQQGGQKGGAVQPGGRRAGQEQQRQGEQHQGPQRQGRQQGAGRPQGAPRIGQGMQPGGIQQPQGPQTGFQPGQPTQPPAAQQPGGIQRQGGFQQRLPSAQRPAAPRKPAPASRDKERR
ncbi:FecR family protein [Bradyrhizobium sp. 1(2017)]|uniref:FecR family protein n=1 Tax=Bradyrhizobium sp. 1(2017) TaxID=1404888 RepID=UPI00140E9A39|nr:FecR domain-containing protein [Bradyrhizobium sp. 1(2017)]QIO37141.1 iron dicitrate transport regulator FecR [Bradyrhizobium sp. 1(2017)]